VAVNITDVPGQKGFGFATIDTAAGSPMLPVIVMILEVTGLTTGQATDEVSTQLTKSPETGLYAKVGLFDPALIPFTFHW
jgi:protein involved in polysaccharide export with SLBB domain